jgi:hypothetical protein
MSKAAMMGGLFAVVMLAAVVYLSMGFNRYTCEVCIHFNGGTQCRSASGADQRTAVRTAQENACAFLVASKTDGFLCGQLQPTRVVCQ